MMPLIAGAARVLATSTRAASIKGAQAAASGAKGAAKGAAVESKAIDKFVKLNDRLSKTNNRDNKNNLSYMQKMEKSVSNMQKSMDSISKSSKGFMNNMKMLVGLGGVGGMLYSFLKITESYGSPKAKFRGKVTSTSLKDQKAFEQMLAIKGINRPDLLDRLGMAATEGGIIGTNANRFFSKYGISPDKFLAENSAGRLSMVLDKWDTIKNIPSVSKFFEEFLGVSWAELKAMREIGDLKSVYNEKYDALKDTDLDRFSKMHESLENIKQNVMNGLVKVFDKLAPSIEKVATALGGGLVKVIEWLADKFQDWDAEKWGDNLIAFFEKIGKIIEFLSDPIGTIGKWNPFNGGNPEKNENANKKIQGLRDIRKKYMKDKSIEQLNATQIQVPVYNYVKPLLNEYNKVLSRNFETRVGSLGKYNDSWFFDNETYEKTMRDQWLDYEEDIQDMINNVKHEGVNISKEDEAFIKKLSNRHALIEVINALDPENIGLNKAMQYVQLMEAKGITDPVSILLNLRVNNNDINQQISTMQSNKQ